MKDQALFHIYIYSDVALAHYSHASHDIVHLSTRVQVQLYIISKGPYTSIPTGALLACVTISNSLLSHIPKLLGMIPVK